MPEKKRGFPAGSVCKPCWELRYCPYGPLVEYFPLPSAYDALDEVRTRYDEVLAEIISGKFKSEHDVWSAIHVLHYLEPTTWEFFLELDPDEVGCKIFGHACPVFFSQSGATETKVPRQEGRYLPREVMLKVVRRDNQHCQLCHKYVPDNEIEFDHIIPHSKGGPTSVENIRLLCRTCNRKKSSGVDELLRE
jgi:hypothetical protein